MNASLQKYPEDKCFVVNFYFRSRSAAVLPLLRSLMAALVIENIASSKIDHINKCNDSKYLHFTI